jgi:hypothetical protein
MVWLMAARSQEASGPAIHPKRKAMKPRQTVTNCLAERLRTDFFALACTTGAA